TQKTACNEKPAISGGLFKNLAERQGFEPWIPCGIHAFQACAFSHSAISPAVLLLLDYHALRVRILHCGRGRWGYPPSPLKVSKIFQNNDLGLDLRIHNK